MRVREYFQPKLAVGWLETIVVSAITLLLCFYFSPNDPFLVKATFPWLWIAPMILALRYGLGHGIFCLILIISAFTWHESLVSLQTQHNRIYLLSGAILTLICAEFSATWLSKIQKAERISQYAESQLDKISKAFFVLRHSHDHLEQSLITKPVTLRKAINDLRIMVEDCDGELTPKYLQGLLDILIYYCGIDRAAFYLMQADGINSKPIANNDYEHEINQNDPLVEKALEQAITTYEIVVDLEENKHSEYVVVAPMITSQHIVYGLLVIKTLPFYALRKENLEVLTVLVGYFANHVEATLTAKPLKNSFPDCPVEFASELVTMQGLSQYANIDAYLVAINIRSHRLQHDILRGLTNLLRGLDVHWIAQDDELITIFNLMPFSNLPSVLGFKQRLDEWLQQKFDLNINKAPFIFEMHKLTPKTKLAELIDEIRSR